MRLLIPESSTPCATLTLALQCPLSPMIDPHHSFALIAARLWTARCWKHCTMAWCSKYRTIHYPKRSSASKFDLSLSTCKYLLQQSLVANFHNGEKGIALVVSKT